MIQGKLNKKSSRSLDRIKFAKECLTKAIKEATDKYPDTTSAEMGAAMLKILTIVNNREIQEVNQ